MMEKVSPYFMFIRKGVGVEAKMALKNLLSAFFNAR